VSGDRWCHNRTHASGGGGGGRLEGHGITEARMRQGPPRHPSEVQNCFVEGWVEGLSSKDHLEGGQERHALLAECGAIA
jgi:hypothetical protein